MSGRLAGKTIAITGASSGLGRAMAIRFAAEGAHVVVGDVRTDPREGGEPTVEVIAGRGGSAEFVEANAARWDDIDHLVRTAVAARRTAGRDGEQRHRRRPALQGPARDR